MLVFIISHLYAQSLTTVDSVIDAGEI